MGNLGNAMRKFVTNKNTVTILGVLAGIIVLWFFYNMRVNKAISPVKVPYANKTLVAQSEITADDIEFMNVSSDMLKTAKVITRKEELVGKYINVGTSVPEGGLFYYSQVVKKEELPNSIFSLIPKGYTIYQLKVDNTSTYGNSIYPGDKIDLYLRYNENSTFHNGKFIENIEVLAVRDNSGQNVFDESSKRTPALLLFAVDDRYFDYLQAAGNLSGVTVYPVPRGGNAEDMGETQLGNTDILEYIQGRALIVND